MKFLNILFLLLLSFGAYAQTELLNEPLRPSIGVVREKYDTIQVAANQLATGSRINFAYFRDSIEDGAPQFITKLEKAYPNGTYMFIGRDTQLIADVVDAFYISIGHKDRVKQVGVSTPTLAGLDADSVMDYLAQYGITIDALKKSTKPMVLVDTISKGEIIEGELVSGRQGRYILQVVYQKWIEAGNDPKDLLKKFNLVGMQVSTFREGERSNNYRYGDIDGLDQITAENETRLTSGNFSLEKLGRTIKVALIKDTQSLFNEAGYDHFTATWHDKYQPPRKVGDKLVANPGPLMPTNFRLSVLWMQKKVIDFVFKAAFTKRVMDEAARMGITFKTAPEKPTKPEFVGPIKVDTNPLFKQRIAALKKSLKPLPAKYGYDKYNVNGETIRLTENGNAILQILALSDSVSANKYFEMSIDLLDTAFESDLIGRRDYKRILTYILGLKSTDGTTIVAMIRKRVLTSEPVNELFRSEKELNTLLKAKNPQLVTNINSIITAGKFGFSCRYAYE